MPGTIQVSVMDFKGLQSSSPSSHVAVKVSMGKREYQTSDKGEFSFPLTTLRDNLIITLQDAEGNEISHIGVETRLVVEKGIWDDLFSLEGGGHVHMKLQFVLSDEEHRRIQEMIVKSNVIIPQIMNCIRLHDKIINVKPLRESALKKKYEELCNSDHGSPKRASVGHSEVSGLPESLLRGGSLAGEASPVLIPFDNLKDSVHDRNRSYYIQKKYMTDSVPPELEKANTSKEQGPTAEAHSNIRKMINAFEGSLNQDLKPSSKLPPAISQTRNSGADSFLANSHLNDVETEKVIPPKVDADSGTASEANEDQKTSRKLGPRTENSEDPQDSRGSVRQVIKVIIMVGFATLVLLTRKRTYR